MNAPIQAGMQTIGWTLIHFVWQGGLLAVVTAACLRLVSTSVVGGSVRDRVRRLDGHAGRARGHRGRLLGSTGGGVVRRERCARGVGV